MQTNILDRSSRCAPAKIRDADAQAVEAAAFAAQLRAAAVQLSGEPVDGPCGTDCACLGARAGRGSGDACGLVDRQPVDVPIACTLEPASMPQRLADWSVVPAAATHRVAVEGGLRIELGPDVDLGALGRLIGAEQHCCAFFSFSLTVGASGTALEVRTPEIAAGIAADLFGRVPASPSTVRF